MGSEDREGAYWKIEIDSTPSLSESSFSVQSAPKRLAAGVRSDQLREPERSRRLHFQSTNAPKTFGGRAPPGPAWGG